MTILLLMSGCGLDQKPGITISPTSGLETTENQAAAEFTILLDAKPDAMVTIEMSSSNTNEGVLSTATVMFSPSDWSTPKTVTITGVDDSLLDGDVEYSIVFQPSQSGDKRYNNKSIKDLVVVNLDNEPPQTPKPAIGVTVTPTTGLSTSENQTSTSFSVVLNSQPSSEVVIAASSTNPDEGVVTPSSVTFNSSNWNTAASFTVTGVDDAVVDGTRDYNITLTAQSSDTDYNGIAITSVSLQNLDNDAVAPTPGLTISPSSGLMTAENQSTATFSVSLNSAPGADVVVNLASSNLSEGTVAPASLTFTGDNWNTAQSVTITGVDDAVMDGTIAYNITFAIQSADSAYDGLTANPVTVQNQDNDTAGITVSPNSGLITSEDLANATFSIVLTSEPTANVSIGITSSDLTEATVSPGNMTFTPANWSTAQTVTINGVDDPDVDGNIAYNVAFTVTSGDSNYGGFTLAPVTAVNQDNDSLPPAGITVTPTAGLLTSETQTTDTFTVVLDSQPSNDVNISLTSSDTTEGTVSPATLTFTSGNWNSAQTVTVTGVDDAIADGNVNYSISFSVQSTDADYNGFSISPVSVTNQNNDTAGVTVSPTSGLITTEAQTSDSFTVRLNSQPGSNVTISIISSDTSEGTVSPSSLTFTTGNWNTNQTVTLTGVDDTQVDGNIAYTIGFSLQSGDTSYNGLSINPISAVNQDNDTAPPPGINVSPTSGLVTSENQTSASFTVTLTSQPSSNVDITLTNSDTTEVAISPASLTFTSGNWNTPQTVTLTGVDDVIVDGDISYSVGFSVQSADLGYNGFSVTPVTAVNQDNDTLPPAAITVTPASGLSTSESQSTDSFTVVLGNQPTANVTISLSSSDTTEGNVSPASLTFTTGNWNTPQTVTVTGADDAIVDGDIAYSINFSVLSTDSRYNGFSINPVTAVNQDNDTLPPAGITVTPASGLVTSEAQTSDTFTVVLDSQPGSTVNITLTSSDTGEGTVSPSSLTFTTGNWNTPQTVTVTGVDDVLVDGDIAYTVSFSVLSGDADYNGFSVTPVTATNQDNDTAPPAGITVTPSSGLVTSEDQTSDTFTVVLDSQPGANVNITLTSSDTGEGTVSPSSLTFTSSNWNTLQTVTVTGVDDALADGDISYSISFSVLSSDTNYNGFSVNPVTATNQDNEPSPPDYILYIEPGSINIAASTISGAGATTLPAMGFSLTATPVGETPGPVIEAVVGQTTTVEVVNDHINTHRFEIEQWLTGTADLLPGETRQFQFTPTEAGVYRYGDPQLLRRAMGLHGAVVVRPAGAPNTAWSGGPAFDQERTWVISDFDETWLRNPSAVDLAIYNPNYFLLNGKSGFDAKQDPASTIEGNVGETFLIRILNAGQYDQSLHFHSNHFQIISEGGFKYPDLPSSPTVTTVNVKRGSSAMVLFTLTQAGTFPVHVHTAQMETGNGVYLNGTATFIIGN